MSHLCIICAQPLKQILTWTSLLLPSERAVVCERCNGKFQLIEGEMCKGCGRPLQDLASEYQKGDYCSDCIRWEEDPKWQGVLKQNRPLYIYNDWMKEVMALYKFRGDFQIREVFRMGWRKIFKTYYSNAFLIVSIPLSPQRLYERGFNQSLALAELLSMPISNILECEYHEKQSKKTRKERLENEYLFSMKEGINLINQDVLLIDDVYTTGTTLRRAAQVLKKARCRSVSSLTLARG